MRERQYVKEERELATEWSVLRLRWRPCLHATVGLCVCVCVFTQHCSKHFSLASFSHNKAAVTTQTLFSTGTVACISLSL